MIIFGKNCFFPGLWILIFMSFFQLTLTFVLKPYVFPSFLTWQAKSMTGIQNSLGWKLQILSFGRLSLVLRSSTCESQKGQLEKERDKRQQLLDRICWKSISKTTPIGLGLDSWKWSLLLWTSFMLPVFLLLHLTFFSFQNCHFSF